MDFKTPLIQALTGPTGLEPQTLSDLMETPPDPQMGDFALPCFAMAKTLRKAPPLIAQQLCDAVELPPFIERAQAAGGYLNFFVNKREYARLVLLQARREDYGRSDEGAGRVVCIDFSSINIAKPFHIGHLSSTVIGHALYNIYNFLGYRAVGINHLGDWGTQFGKLIVAFKLWGDRETIEKGGVAQLLKIYVRFHEEAEKDGSLDEQARLWFKRIEDGDGEAMELFHWFKELTLKEVGRVYDLLGVKFDSYAGESFYNDKMAPVVQELRQKGLLVKSQGAEVVEFNQQDDMPPCLILKSDGATLYATRDIAAAFYRKAEYDFYKSLYVVAYQQNLHFKQWFKVVEMMGYSWAKDLEHIGFGMVSIEGETLSTRKGKVVFLEDVLKRAIAKSGEIIAQKSPDLENKEEVARQVGVGAIVYAMLSGGRIKDITFSWDRALNFDGETGPYCQYTYARCRSVLAKGGAIPQDVDCSRLEDEKSMAVVRLLAQFPPAVARAMEEREPFMITKYVTELAKAYNRVYFDYRILNAPEEEKLARLALTQAVAGVIKSGLGLIGLEAPPRM